MDDQPHGFAVVILGRTWLCKTRLNVRDLLVELDVYLEPDSRLEFGAWLEGRHYARIIRFYSSPRWDSNPSVTIYKVGEARGY